jgi:septum formation protein
MQTKASPQLVLASGSPRRQQLLESLGLNFLVHPSGADEDMEGIPAPAEYVTHLARRKAERVAAVYKDKAREEGRPYVVLSADTTVVVDGLMLGKPTSEAHARELLMRLEGRRHTVFTGVCVMDAESGRAKTGFSTTDVWMRPLTREEIDRYIASGEPMDKAGAYAIQGLGAVLVRRIEGDYFTVVGLPVGLVVDYLEEFGIRVL